MIMDDVRTLVGLDGITDETLKAQTDKRLDVIMRITVSHFMTYTGALIVPQELEYIITELVVRRYNRIESEGISKHTKEGITIEFDKADFSSYDAVLKATYPERFMKGGIKFI